MNPQFLTLAAGYLAKFSDPTTLLHHHSTPMGSSQCSLSHNL
jgi:hypothetical protein